MERATVYLRWLIVLCAGWIAPAGADAGRAAVRATAEISGPGGVSGRATFVENRRGTVVVSAALRGDPAVLTPGLHGVHIHEVGVCDPPEFKSAGGHYDPGPFGNPDTVKNHPFHMGDLANLVVNEQGEGRLHDTTTRVTLSPSDVTVFDADGSALIIHKLGDERSCKPDPKTGVCTGQSGGPRLACGVIEPARR